MSDLSQQDLTPAPGDPAEAALVADRLAKLAYNFEGWAWTHDAATACYVGERERGGIMQRLVVVPPYLSAWVPWTVRLTVGTIRSGWSASNLQLASAVRQVVREMGNAMGHEYE